MYVPGCINAADEGLLLLAFRRRRYKKKMTPMRITTRTPPTTPPMVPPMIFDLELGELDPEGRVVAVIAGVILADERDPVEDGTEEEDPAVACTKEGFGMGE